MVIKAVLREELENSKRLKKEYEKALRELPQGALVSKVIKGHCYYYLVKRVAGKVKYFYKGKIAESERKKYEMAKKMRVKYKKLLSQAKKQISFLERSLRGREEV
ncbi:MAG: hypothetical protein KJ811_03480 [Candidatus Margulisbacteria bacterium]|nr:hypothetical protein [Candidatus Margulisiibacteriota bacterium]